MKKIALLALFVGLGLAASAQPNPTNNSSSSTKSAANSTVSAINSLSSGNQSKANATTGNSSSSGKGWKSHTQCEANETPVANLQGAFKSTWTTQNCSANKTESAQNHGDVNANVGVNVGAVSASIGGGFKRDGGTTANEKNQCVEEKHETTYDCVEVKDKKK